DGAEWRAPHWVTADPFRTPTFTPFADPNWFFFASGSPATCATQAACAFIPARTSQSFAWNHGDLQDEIASTWAGYVGPGIKHLRSEEHTSELQSLTNLVCRLLLEKKKKSNNQRTLAPPSHYLLTTSRRSEK